MSKTCGSRILLALADNMSVVSSCFLGCSFTLGEGFSQSERELYIYDRLVAKTFGWKHTNLGTGGASNYKIFMAACNALRSKKFNVVFVQWSALNRIWFYPGPDTYFFVNGPDIDYKYRYIHLTANERCTLRKHIQILNHDYQNIIELIDYCAIINTLASSLDIDIVFINGLVPWQNDLATDIPVDLDLSKHLSSYTKEILDFDHRDDNEILQFFKNLRSKFAELDQSKWINLFDSMLDNTIDTGPEGHHPGKNSHAWIAGLTTEYIIKNLKELT